MAGGGEPAAPDLLGVPLGQRRGGLGDHLRRREGGAHGGIHVS